MMFKQLGTLWIGLSVMLLPAAIYADMINVDFGNQNPAPSSTYGAAASQEGVWNNVDATGITNNLVDLGGTATAISVNVIADTIGGASGNYVAGDDTSALRADNFYSQAPDLWSVTFSNLSDGTYSLYYYAPENTLVSTGAISANGVTGTSLSGNHDATLVEGQDWAVLTVSVTNGTLQINDTSNPGYAGLAGIQLVEGTVNAVPEPSSMSLLMLASALLLFAARRLRAQRARLLS